MSTKVRGDVVVVGEKNPNIEVWGSIPAPFKLFSRDPAELKFVQCQRTRKKNW